MNTSVREVVGLQNTIKGQITRQFTVWCALCDEWYQVSCNIQTGAVKRFELVSWKKDKKHGWLCPDHATK